MAPGAVGSPLLGGVPRVVAADAEADEAARAAIDNARDATQQR